MTANLIKLLNNHLKYFQLPRLGKNNVNKFSFLNHHHAKLEWSYGLMSIPMAMLFIYIKVLPLLIWIFEFERFIKYYLIN